jgi:hypothetical protein
LRNVCAEEECVESRIGVQKMHEAIPDDDKSISQHAINGMPHELDIAHQQDSNFSTGKIF